MTTYNIPVSTTYPWYQTKVTLSGVVYTLIFRFNNRSMRWILDIQDASGNDILIGLPMLINTDLMYQYRNTVSGLPAGTLYVVDNSGANSQPTQYSFGVTHSLLYADPTT